MNSTSSSLSFFSTTYEYVAWSYSASTVVLCGLLCVFGDFHAAFNIIDAVVMIYFLFFAAVKFPNNVVDFSKFFGENHYSFFPNPIQSIFSTNVYQQTYATFKANGYSSLFICNASLQLNLVIIVLAAYILLKCMSYIPNLEILKRHVFRAWEWNAMIYLFWVFSFQFLVYGFLQTKIFDVNTGLEITSIILMFISFGISAAFPLLFSYLIYADQSDLSIPASQRTHIIQYTCLILGLKISKQQSSKANPAIKEAASQNQINEGDQETVVLVQVNEPTIVIPQKNELQEDVYDMYSPYEQGQFSILAKYTNVAVSVRRIAFALLITIIYSHIEIQMLCDCFLNVVLCVFYIWKRPYILHIDNYRNAVHEILFCLMQLIICAFNNLSSTSDYLSLLGWFYISFALTILLLSYLDLCYKLYRAIYKYSQKRKNEANHVTVVPVNKDIALDDSNDQAQKPSPIPQENITKQQEPTVNNQTQKSQSELPKTEQPNLQAEKTQQPLPQAEKTQTQLPNRLSDTKVQAPENNAVQDPSNQATTRPILKENTETIAKNPILNTVTQPPQNKMTVMETKAPLPVIQATQTAISLQELPVFTKPPANNQPISYSHREVLETKQRFKKLLFTRNPFMSVEDEELIKKEKAQESRASMHEMKSHKLI